MHWVRMVVTCPCNMALIRREQLLQIVTGALKAAGVNEDIEVRLLEESAAALYTPELAVNAERYRRHTLIVDIGSGTTDLVVAYSGRAVASTGAPIAGQDFTTRLGKLEQYKDVHAENLDAVKLSLEVNSEEYELFKANCTDLLLRLQAAVVRVMALAGVSVLDIGGVVFVGGGSLLKFVREAIMASFGNLRYVDVSN